MYPYYEGLNHPKEGTAPSNETWFFAVSTVCVWELDLLDFCWSRRQPSGPTPAMFCDWHPLYDCTIGSDAAHPAQDFRCHGYIDNFFFQIETPTLAQENTGQKTQEFRCVELCICEIAVCWHAASNSSADRSNELSILTVRPKRWYTSIKLHGASSQRTADPNVRDPIPPSLPGRVPVPRKIRFGTPNVLGFPKAIEIRHFWQCVRKIWLSAGGTKHLKESDSHHEEYVWISD